METSTISENTKKKIQLNITIKKPIKCVSYKNQDILLIDPCYCNKDVLFENCIMPSSKSPDINESINFTQWGKDKILSGLTPYGDGYYEVIGTDDGGVEVDSGSMAFIPLKLATKYMSDREDLKRGHIFSKFTGTVYIQNGKFYMNDKVVCDTD